MLIIIIIIVVIAIVIGVRVIVIISDLTIVLVVFMRTKLRFSVLGRNSGLIPESLYEEFTRLARD